MAHAIINKEAAWNEALKLTSYDNGNTKSNTLYWIATRPQDTQGGDDLLGGSPFADTPPNFAFVDHPLQPSSFWGDLQGDCHYFFSQNTTLFTSQLDNDTEICHNIPSFLQGPIRLTAGGKTWFWKMETSQSWPCPTP